MKKLWLVFLLLLWESSSSHFDSRSSISFRLTNQSFELSYLDGTELTGSICRDRIKIGELETYSSFGCISPRHKSFMFSGESSGILGMGFPVGDKNAHATNLFESITSSGRVVASSSGGGNHSTNDATLAAKVFTLIIDNNDGSELQLGGYDLSRIKNAQVVDAFDVPVLAECEDGFSRTSGGDCSFRHFRITVDTLRLGKI